MRVRWGKTAWTGLALAGLWASLTACNPDDPSVLAGSGNGKPCPPDTTGGTTTASSGGTGGTGGTGGGSATVSSSSSGGGVTGTVLDDRVIAYSEALRTASLKLLGSLPKLDQIEGIRTAADPKAVYEGYIDEFMRSPLFAARMIDFWKNTLRLGNVAGSVTPNRDGAPNFAAKLTVEGLDYRQLFTAASGTCPTFDPMTGTFTPADCPNGPVTAGILTDQGFHFQYASAFGFRRVRVIQETFACHKMPAEWRPDPMPKGAGTYTSPWPFDTIAGKANGGRVDFLDTSSAICANCHTTMNHRAPLFAVFDDNGAYNAPTPSADGSGALEFSVIVPIDMNPKARMSDYLPPGEQMNTSWKFGKAAPTLVEFGQQMAADDEVSRCAVVRMWDYAFSKGDPVYDIGDVPDAVIGPLVEQFKSNGYNLRDIVRAVFVHDDFVRY